MQHGPGDSFFDQVLQAIVPQPGPQWMPEDLPEEEAVVPPIGEVGLEEFRWRSLLMALIPHREPLESLVQLAQDDVRRLESDTAGATAAGAPASAAGQRAWSLRLSSKEERATRQETAMRAVRRSVWLNLGPARDTLLAMPTDMRVSEIELAAAKGRFARPPGEHCTDIQGLASAIDNAWAVGCDPEELWAAQALLGECRAQGALGAKQLVEP